MRGGKIQQAEPLSEYEKIDFGARLGVLEAAITGADVLSHTRIQKERFSTETEYKKYKGVYVLTPALMKKAPDSMIVIHPLPRVDEIDMAVDKDPRARYFEQVENGVAVRMAILAELLGL